MRFFARAGRRDRLDSSGSASVDMATSRWNGAARAAAASASLTFSPRPP